MKVRNILFLVLASLLLCTAVSAAEYTDVSDTQWAYKQIDYLSAEINGYPDGSYKPEKSVSRAEFLTLFARIAFPDEWKRVEGEEWWKSAYERHVRIQCADAARRNCRASRTVLLRLGRRA